MAQDTLEHDNRDSGAAPTPPPRAREQGVSSRSKRPGDDAFLKRSVVCKASSPREEFSSEAVDSVVAKASALLAAVRKTSLHPTELLPVEKDGSEMDHITYQGQNRAALTLALVKALRMASDEARDPVLWQTPEEEQEESRRVNTQGVYSRDRG